LIKNMTIRFDNIAEEAVEYAPVSTPDPVRNTVSQQPSRPLRVTPEMIAAVNNSLYDAAANLTPGKEP
jgi:hypothetical protein